MGIADQVRSKTTLGKVGFVVEPVARTDGVGRDMDLHAALKQVVDGLADADVGLDPADDRLIAAVEAKAIGADG